MSTKAHASTRLPFIDTLRGLAVVFMVPLHTSHSWFRTDLRQGNVWHSIQFFGGMAAPIFLAVAGVSMGLRWANAEKARARPNYRADVIRALQLVVLGYALRLQMWIIDGSGYSQRHSYLAELLLLLGYALAYLSLDWADKRPREAQRAGLAALALIVLGFWRVNVTSIIRLPGLTRVDVLQCIGVSLLLVVVVGRARRTQFGRPGVYGLVAIAITFATIWTRSWVPGPFPEAVAAYLGQWTPPSGKSVLGLFPLFPWAAYTFFGTALGLWLGKTPVRDAPMTVIALAAVGACLGLANSESMPHVFHTLATHAWLTQPVRVAYRIGVLLVLAGGSLVLGHARSPVRGLLDTFGRASLLVYWVHLEFAFGAAARPVSKALTATNWALGTFALLVAMWMLAYVRVQFPNAKQRFFPKPEPLTESPQG